MKTSLLSFISFLKNTNSINTLLLLMEHLLKSRKSKPKISKLLKFKIIINKIKILINHKLMILITMKKILEKNHSEPWALHSRKSINAIKPLNNLKPIWSNSMLISAFPEEDP
jgi:hypothetical protein